MGNNYFRFKQFVVKQETAAMKVGTDGVLLGAWVDIENINSVLDIGTGSGVIALMIAQRCNARIQAIEIDIPSAVQAKHNFEQSLWNNRLSVEALSLQEYSKNHSAKFDLIVSNPPYFNKSLKSPSPERTLTRHTDELPNADLLVGISNLLQPEGRFCAIFPYTEGNIFIAEAINYGLFCNKKLFVQTKPDKPVIRVLMEFSFIKRRLPDRTISIHTTEGEYTEEYKWLTADFYLAF
ncbi:MAG: methyltransferase domain-containing protein [Bacteroidales bacterium]|nr:MAG: methyltransferase domain-containing protein [Bacteroidales bacterium]